MRSGRMTVRQTRGVTVAVVYYLCTETVSCGGTATQNGVGAALGVVAWGALVLAQSTSDRGTWLITRSTS